MLSYVYHFYSKIDDTEDPKAVMVHTWKKDDVSLEKVNLYYP